MTGAGRLDGNDGTASLAARAAWLYFSGGLTQSEIGKRLGVPATKAHRLIARASRDGLIRVFVDAGVAECIALEEALADRFSLDVCHVAPDLGEEGPLPLKALGVSGAAFLRGVLETEPEAVIGVGNGRTIAAAVEHLPPLSAPKARFVAVLGGLTQKFAANPFDVIHRLAERTGADAYFLPVPIFADSIEDRRVLMAQRGMNEALQLVRRAAPVLAGVGELVNTSFLTICGHMNAGELADLKRAGAAGEILGHFFDADGRLVETHLSDRATSPEVADLRRQRVVAIAGGPSKVEAIRAVLRSGVLGGLITDEATAMRLLEGERALNEVPTRGGAKPSARSTASLERTP